MDAQPVDVDDLARMSSARLGELLRSARRDRNRTVEQVADAAAVARRDLKRWEKGFERPTAVQLGALAGALEMEVAELVPPRDLVAFHPGTGTLTVGSRTAGIVHRATDADGNDAILRTYLEAVRTTRGAKPTSVFALRRDDIVTLAQLLHLDDDDLELRLMKVLGLTSAEASEARRRLLTRRAALVAAAAAAGVVATVPLASAAFGTNAIASAPAAVVSVMAPSALGNAAADGAALVVSASPATPAPAPAAAPAAVPPATQPPGYVSPVQLPNDADGDGIDIGDALVIQRATQPADPGVQLGDTYTYER